MQGKSLSFRMGLGFVVASYLVTLAACSGGPPSTRDAGQKPAPEKKVEVPAPPDPKQELAEVVARGERAMVSATPKELLELDKLLYEKALLVNPADPLVTKARKLRASLKLKLYPTYMDMAEESFEKGYYDDAFRQAGYVPDSADPKLVRRKKALLAKKPAIERRRKACAKRWTLRACKLHEKHPDWSLKICKALYDEMIGLDMTPEMVRISWGDPKKVDRTVDDKGNVQVVWYYDKGATVVFDGPSDDELKVTEVQN